MRLAALVEHPDHVCCRYRLRALRTDSAGCGVHVRLPVPRQRLVVAPLLLASHPSRRRRRSPAPVPAWLATGLVAQRHRLIFDLDDAVFLRDSYSPRGLQKRRQWRRFRAIAHKADVVVAGNPFLQAKSLEASARQTIVIPTCVDADRYQLAEHARQDAGVQMIWVGSSSTLQGLTRIGPLLESIGQRWLGLSLKLICDRFFHLPHLPVIPCSWSGQTEALEIAAADIGIDWIPDDDWSRGKCGLKILQYMAAGLPVVANPVGVHRDMVIHGETGFLAASPNDWIEAVGRLMHDRELRHYGPGRPASPGNTL